MGSGFFFAYTALPCHFFSSFVMTDSKGNECWLIFRLISICALCNGTDRAEMQCFISPRSALKSIIIKLGVCFFSIHTFIYIVFYTPEGELRLTHFTLMHWKERHSTSTYSTTLLSGLMGKNLQLQPRCNLVELALSLKE